ncbi:MAG: tol-pal system protein YbgF [Deltaproteobacteria bacterium]|nr:tol-pal system protein YbgF [Deltaproteobacteria bacterium]
MNSAPILRTSRWGLLALTATASAAGCGPSRASLEEKIHGLEREIAALSAQKVNLQAHGGAQDDKILILEKKVETCEKGNGPPKLDVVRLEPGGQTVQEPANSIIREETAIPRGRKGSGVAARPLLVLHGESTFAGEDLSAEAPASIPPAGGDSLGVVPVGGSLAGAVPSAEGPMDLFQTAYRDYSNKQYDPALAGFAVFVRDNPTHDYADNAIFWRGECYMALGKYLKAAYEFERLVGRYPASDSAASAMYRTGFAYDQLRDRAKAMEYYFKVVEQYPGSDAARKASMRVAAMERQGGGTGGLMPTASTR